MNKNVNDPHRFIEHSKLSELCYCDKIKLTSFDISQIHLHHQYLYIRNTEK